MAELIPDLESVVVHIPGVGNAIYDEAEEREHVANGFLEEARATTTHTKIVGPAHLTNTSVERLGPVDSQFSLNAPSPESIEFGHNPSGVFDPDRYGRRTKPPEGLYILHRAAGLV